jgi:hypothetical protein
MHRATGGLYPIHSGVPAIGPRRSAVAESAPRREPLQEGPNDRMLAMTLALRTMAPCRATAATQICSR